MASQAETQAPSDSEITVIRDTKCDDDDDTLMALANEVTPHQTMEEDAPLLLSAKQRSLQKYTDSVKCRTCKKQIKQFICNKCKEPVCGTCVFAAADKPTKWQWCDGCKRWTCASCDSRPRPVCNECTKRYCNACTQEEPLERLGDFDPKSKAFICYGCSNREGLKNAETQDLDALEKVFTNASTEIKKRLREAEKTDKNGDIVNEDQHEQRGKLRRMVRLKALTWPRQINEQKVLDLENKPWRDRLPACLTCKRKPALGIALPCFHAIVCYSCHTKHSRDIAGKECPFDECDKIVGSIGLVQNTIQ